MHATELGKPHFTQAPKVLNSVDMVVSFGELIFAVFDAKMSLISKISQAVISFKTIGINRGFSIGLLRYNRHYFNHVTILRSKSLEEHKTLEAWTKTNKKDSESFRNFYKGFQAYKKRK
jgi:hypothetical protein